MVELRLTRTKNNLFYTLKDSSGTIFHGSSRSFSSMRKGRRSSPLSGELSAYRVSKHIKSRALGVLDLVVVSKARSDPFLKSVFRGLSNRSIFFRSVSFIYPVSHNGLRKAKSRRL